jgi:hypothetical protein
LHQALYAGDQASPRRLRQRGPSVTVNRMRLLGTTGNSS